MTDWQKIVKRFADGKSICNCGDAYYTNCGKGISVENGVSKYRDDLPVCQYGCAANQIAARNVIASKIITEIEDREI